MVVLRHYFWNDIYDIPGAVCYYYAWEPWNCMDVAKVRSA